MTPITPSIKVGFNARLFPGAWRPAREEIAFAHAHGFSALQFRGPVTGLDAARLGDPFAAVATALRAARLIAVMEIVVPVDRAGRPASGATPLDALHANLPAITALPCTHVHIHAVPDEPMPAILEIGGLPQSGGFGRDTDAALIDSRERLDAAMAASSIAEASRQSP